MRILITDANQRSSLAVTRSLGIKGIHVVTADEDKTALSSKSKYCSSYFTYPSPYKHPQEFLKSIEQELVKRNINILLPMTDVTTYLILKKKNDLEKHVKIPFPSFSAFDLVTDKIKLLNLTKNIDIPFPKTWLVKNKKELHNLISDLEFPVVVKAAKSKTLLDGQWISTAVRYAANSEELKNIIEKEKHFGSQFLIQKRVVGPGAGIFTLFNHGKPIVFFAHKRLREKPPSGGVSVLRESIPVDPQMQELTTQILSHVNWHGVAMVEFKIDEKTNTPFLIEVNGRFWGSLQLAIDSGIDFPYLLYKMALNKSLGQPNNYTVGLKSRWFLGDLDHLYMRLFKNGLNLPSNYPSKLECILDFLNIYDKNTRFEIESFSDPRPSLYEIEQYIRELFR